jgi:hypothetical protein
MTSRFGWLDHDDAQRAQMMEVVKFFQDQGSVDELGIGSIRDAFSDSFFPGTSVLHTRARYLLFIPWLLGDVARRGRSVDESRKALREAEVKLIRALIAGGEQAGVIGSQAQDKLKTMPSQVYWPALGRLRLRHWDVTIDGYFRTASQRARRSTEVSVADAASARVDLGLDSALPPHPDDLLNETTFALTPDEADMLKAVFVRLPSSSLLGWLGAHAESAAADWVWQHPQVGDMPDQHRARIDHARRLHHVWHGAPLLYNLMLARLVEDDELVDQYYAETDEWLQDLADERAFEGWSRQDFWALLRHLNPRIGPPTVAFVNKWIDLVEAGEHSGERAEQLVRDRELRLKGRRSRLVYPDARAGWSGYAGLVRLDYRWRVARRFMGDVLVGLNAGAG